MFKRQVGDNNRVRVHILDRFDDVICIKYQIPVFWRVCEVISLVTGYIIWALLRKNRKITGWKKSQLIENKSE